MTTLPAIHFCSTLRLDQTLGKPATIRQGQSMTIGARLTRVEQSVSQRLSFIYLNKF
jgi:hypothetical protein